MKINNEMKRLLFTLILTVLFLKISAQDRFTDLRDGNSYRTVTIEGVTWMAENLKYKAKGSGTYYFDNNPDNIPAYGILYEWETAMKACPDGWHLPSGSEFRTLANHFEIEEKWEKTGSGPLYFGIQLSGMQDYEGIFTEVDESAYYWTSTEYDNNEAEFFSYVILDDKPIIDISRKEDMPDIHGAEKNNRYSVRCMKN
jgi:uncharacterized protein (TIGR02145 family)